MCSVQLLQGVRWGRARLPLHSTNEPIACPPHTLQLTRMRVQAAGSWLGASDWRLTAHGLPHWQAPEGCRSCCAHACRCCQSRCCPALLCKPATHFLVCGPVLHGSPATVSHHSTVPLLCSLVLTCGCLLVAAQFLLAGRPRAGALASASIFAVSMRLGGLACMTSCVRCSAVSDRLPQSAGHRTQSSRIRQRHSLPSQVGFTPPSS